MLKKTYKFDEAAEYLNISETSLSDLVAIGEIPAAKISLRWVFRESDLDSYLSEQVQVQTEQRRKNYQSGRGGKVGTSISQVRRGRRVLPVLPGLPVVG